MARFNYLLIFGLVIVTILGVSVINNSTGFVAYYEPGSPSYINITTAPNDFNTTANDTGNVTGVFTWDDVSRQAIAGNDTNQVVINVTEASVWNESNAELVLNGNMNIYGNVSFDNVTLKMNCSSANMCEINVYPTGRLVANNSFFTSYDSVNKYNFTDYGYINIQNSNLSYVIGNNSNGLIITSSNNILANNNISEFYNDFIYLDYATSGNNISYNNFTDVHGNYHARVIYLYYSSGNIIINNNMKLISGGYGIFLQSSDNNQIIFNTVYNLTNGIVFQGESNNNYISNNDLRNNSYSMFIGDVGSCSNNVPLYSNLGGYIGGTKYVYYLNDTTGVSVSSYNLFSQMILCNVSNSSFSNGIIDNSYMNNDGILILASSYVNITNNTFRNINGIDSPTGSGTNRFILIKNNTFNNTNYGIHSMGGVNNTITNNTMNNSNSYFIMFTNANANTTVSDNIFGTISVSYGRAVILDYASEIYVINNSFKGNMQSENIKLSNSQNIKIINNTMTNSAVLNGILCISSCNNNSIIGNTLVGSGGNRGFVFSENSNDNIMLNNNLSSFETPIYFENYSLNNNIYNNNFLNNQNGVYVDNTSQVNWIVNETSYLYNNPLGMDLKQTEMTIESTGMFTMDNTPVKTGNLNVSGNFVYKNSKSSIIISGNLNISGNYTLDNATLAMNCSSDGGCGIDLLSTGRMNVGNDSLITNLNSNPASNNYTFAVYGAINVDNSTVEYARDVAVTPSNGILVYSSYNNFTNSVFRNSYSGISFAGSETINNTIFNNKFYGNKYYDLLISSGASFYNIIGNSIYSDSMYGIRMMSSSNNTIEGNNFSKSRLEFWSSNNNVVNGNNFTTSGYGVYDSGNSNYNTYSNNNFTTTIDSIDCVNFGGSHNILINNRFENCTRNGIVLQNLGAINNTMYNSVFYNNARMGIDATGLNWIINETGYSSGNMINITNGNITVSGTLLISNSPMSNSNTNITSTGSMLYQNSKDTNIVSGNLTVSGNYTLDNSTLAMNCSSNGNCGIYLLSQSNFSAVNDSLITSYNSSFANYTFNAGNAHSINITGSTVEYTNYAGIMINGVSIVDFRNSVFRNSNVAFQFLFKYPSPAYIVNNTIYNIGWMAIDVPGIAVIDIVNNTIYNINSPLDADNQPTTKLRLINNTIHDYYGGSINNNVNSTEFINNTFYNAADCLYIQGASYNNSFINNTFNNCSNTGITLHSSYQNYIVNNTFVNNSNRALYSATTGPPIQNNNTIINNTFISNGAAIEFWTSSDNKIYNNTIINSGTGVHIHVSSLNNIFNNNSISNSTGYDFQSYDTSTNNTIINLTTNDTTSSFTYNGDVFLKAATGAGLSNPPGYYNLSHYLNITGTDWVFINVTFKPSDIPPEILDNSTLKILKNLGGSLWTTDVGTPNTVDLSNLYVYANITNFGSIFAPMGGTNTEPYWDSEFATPTSLTGYSPGAPYQFNISWHDNEDNFDNATFEFDGANYTTFTTPAVVNTSENWSITLIDLPVGNYTYRWYGIDEDDAENSTGTYDYNVTKAVPALFNGVSNLFTYPNITTRTCSISQGDAGTTLNLYRNGTLVDTNTDSVSETILLGVGDYNYSCEYTGSENYTTRLTDAYTGILQNTSTASLMHIAINGTESDRELIYPNATNVTAWSDLVEQNITLEFVGWIEGVPSSFLFGTGDPISQVTLLDSGRYSYRYQTVGNQNYTAGDSYIRYLNITAGDLGIIRIETDVNETFIGRDFKITATVNNSGEIEMKNITLWFTLNNDTWFDSDEEISDLLPGESFEYDEIKALPALGTYEITAYVNTSTPDSNETNNYNSTEIIIKTSAQGGGPIENPIETPPIVYPGLTPESIATFPGFRIGFYNCTLKDKTYNIPPEGATVVLQGSLDEDNHPTPGTAAVLLYPSNISGNETKPTYINNIRCIEPQQYAIVHCNQSIIASYEVDVKSDLSYLCINYEGTDVVPESVTINLNKDGAWQPITITNLLHNVDKKIICGNITGHTPYMVSGFVPKPEIVSAMEAIDALKSAIDDNCPIEVCAEAETLLEQAKQAYESCDYSKALALANQGRALFVSQKSALVWIILSVIVIAGVAGLFQYFKKSKK